MFLFLVDDLNPIEAGLLPDGSPDLYFRGFYCWNSEVGAKTLGIASFYLRAVCQNRNLWGVEDFQEIAIRHSKYAASRFAHEAAPALSRFAESSPAPFIDGIRAARKKIVARSDEDRQDFLRKRGLSKAETGPFSASRDIPFNKLMISQSNVRHVKAGVSIEELAEDIARRTLLSSITVRPVLDDSGAGTGMYTIPAGGRRFRALERLVKQKRMNKTALVPCIVGTDGLAEEDSLAENVQRAPLHPLDQFRACPGRYARRVAPRRKLRPPSSSRPARSSSG